MTQNGLHAAAEPQASQAPLGRHGHRPPNAPWRRPICRTSRLEPQANGPFPSRSDCSEKRCRQTCRLPRERRPEDETTDAMDIEVPETRFRGRSHALLYNTKRPHQGREGQNATGTTEEVRLDTGNAGVLTARRDQLAVSTACGARGARFVVAQDARRSDPRLTDSESGECRLK
jgi:hypothetical protein